MVFSDKLLNSSFFTRFICHRIPERTFKFRGLYFPFCSRCTGLLIGAFFYTIFIIFIPFQYTIYFFLIGIVITIPTFLDGITQFMGFRESNNILRFTTGLIGGFGLLILVKFISFIVMDIF